MLFLSVSPMASTISSSDHHLHVSKKRSKPLILRDYLLDDLSSCSSNGFKSLPRHQSTTGDIKRRLTCGLAFTHAVQKASTALLNAVKLLPSPSSSANPPSQMKRLFSASFSRNLWKKLSYNVVDREMEDRTQEIQRCRSFGDFLKESLDQPSEEDTLSKAAGGDSASFGSEIFTNSELTQSSSETSNKNDAVEDVTEETSDGVVVMMSGDCVGSHVSDGSSSANDNGEEIVSEEKEQLSPISILECSFEDDATTPPNSHQQETDDKNLMRKTRRTENFVRLEPVDLKKRIDKYVKRQDYDSHMGETEEGQWETQANRLFAQVKSRLIEEQRHLLASQKVDGLLLDFFKEDAHIETRDEDKLVKIVEEWVLRRQEEECMFMSWEVREKREIYVKEMKWGCINVEESDYVVEELENGLVTDLIYELILDLSL
ncbi:Uncharacterized protein HA466_0166440 [Hirschfeldia incana]|nr:Uncharacterized protein HA466_0166440 [Hirschfeldia incana]